MKGKREHNLIVSPIIEIEVVYINMINFTPLESTLGGAIIGEFISEYVFRSVIALEGMMAKCKGG